MKKSDRIYIGVDNGVTGTIGIVGIEFPFITPVPVKTEQSYTKTKQNITRVRWMVLRDILNYQDALVLIERPMVNPGRLKATLSAMRCLEAVLIAVEWNNLAFQYVDSKEWQSVMLPKGIEKEELKTVSLQIGKRLFPKIDWTGFKDADSILMAEWARRKGL